MTEKKKTYTVVKGVRATPSQFAKWNKVAKSEGTNRNKLIVRVMDRYCEKELNLQKNMIPVTIMVKDDKSEKYIDIKEINND